LCNRNNFKNRIEDFGKYNYFHVMLTSVTENFSQSEFLSLAMMIEHAAIQDYAWLSKEMESRHLLDVASIFGDFSSFSAMQKDAILSLAKAEGVALESEYDLCLKRKMHGLIFGPTAWSGDGLKDALLYIREKEAAVRAYYESVASSTTNTDVHNLAVGFADNENDQVLVIDKWLDMLPVA